VILQNLKFGCWSNCLGYGRGHSEMPPLHTHGDPLSHSARRGQSQSLAFSGTVSREIKCEVRRQSSARLFTIVSDDHAG